MCGNVDYIMNMCYSMSCDLTALSLSYFDRLHESGIVILLEKVV